MPPKHRDLVKRQDYARVRSARRVERARRMAEPKGPLILSRSDMDMWLGCKRRFFLEYVCGVKRKWPEGQARPSMTFDIGSMFHACIEYKMKGLDMPPVGMVCQEYARETNGLVNTPEGVMYGEGWEKNIRTVEHMVPNWLAWLETDNPFAQYTITSVEQHRVWEILPGELHIEFTTDALLQHNDIGDYTLLDGKTVASFEKQWPTYGNFQGLTYAAGLLELEEIEVSYFQHMQAKRALGKKEGMELFQMSPPLVLDLNVIERHIDRLERMAEEILEFVNNSKGLKSQWHFMNAPYAPSGECGWKCKVNELCEMIEGNEAILPMTRPSKRMYYRPDPERKRTLRGNQT